MADVDDLDDRVVADLELDRFVRLVRVVVENELTEDGQEQSVTITLRPDDLGSAERLSLRFEGVENLWLRGLTAGDLCRLAVEGIADRGWDRLRYLVADLDEECLSFCAARLHAGL